MAYTQAQLDEIQITQEQRGLTRKSAVQFCTRKWKREAAEAAKAAKRTPPAVPGDSPVYDRIPPTDVVRPAAAPKPVKAAKPADQPHEQRKPKPASDGKRLAAPTPAEAKEIVRLYKGGAGMSVPDLAEKFGRRDKGNRIRRVLVAAGVYAGTCGKWYGGE
jgi:hypothetical protein